MARVDTLVIGLQADTAQLRRDLGATQRLFRSSMQDAASSTQAVNDAMAAMGKTIAAGFGAGAIVSFGNSIRKTATDFQSMQNALAASVGSVTAGGESFKFVAEVSRALGLDLEQSAKGFTTLAASAKGTKLEGDGVKNVFLAMSKSASVMGLSAETTGRVFTALGQMLSKGTVQSEELKGQIGEALPGAFQIAARAMGLTTVELGKMLEQGKLMADDFLPKFAKQMEKEIGGGTATSVASALASFNRLGNAWDELKVAIGDTGVLDAMSAVAGSIAKEIMPAFFDTAAAVNSAISSILADFAVLTPGISGYLKEASVSFANFGNIVALATGVVKSSWATVVGVVADSLAIIASGWAQLMDLIGSKSPILDGLALSLSAASAKLGADYRDSTAEVAKLFEKIERGFEGSDQATNDNAAAVSAWADKLKDSYGGLIKKSDEFAESAKKARDAAADARSPTGSGVLTPRATGQSMTAAVGIPAPVVEPAKTQSIAKETEKLKQETRADDRAWVQYMAAEEKRLAREQATEEKAIAREQADASHRLDEQYADARRVEDAKRADEENAISIAFDDAKSARSDAFHISESNRQAAFDQQRLASEKRLQGLKTKNQNDFQNREIVHEEQAKLRKAALGAETANAGAKIDYDKTHAVDQASYAAALVAESRLHEESAAREAALDRQLATEKLNRQRENDAIIAAQQEAYDNQRRARELQFGAEKEIATRNFSVVETEFSRRADAEKASRKAVYDAQDRATQATFYAQRFELEAVFEARRLRAQENFQALALRNAKELEGRKAAAMVQSSLPGGETSTATQSWDTTADNYKPAYQFATGGSFVAQGYGGTDSVPLRVSPGERVTVQSRLQQAAPGPQESGGQGVTMNIVMNGIQNVGAFVRELEQYTRTNPAAIRLRSGLTATG